MRKSSETFAKRKIFSTMTLLIIGLVLIVSATFAWFILSSAPEVVGIHNTIAANGSLEIALLNDATAANLSLIANPVGSSLTVAPTREANVTWGNLVDLGDESYGLDHIVLRPGQPNLIDAGSVNSTVLRTAEYGADGRVDRLAANTRLAAFSENNAFDAEAVGVRAIGIDTGMSSREAAFTSYLSEGDTCLTMASSAASSALNAGGKTLAEIVLAAEFAGRGDGTPVTGEQVDSLRTAYSFLHNDGGTGALDWAEKALIAYARAYAVSAAGDPDDAAAAGLASAISSREVLQSLPLPAAFADALEELETGMALVSAGLAGLPGEGDTTFAALDDAGGFRSLCDPERTYIRGKDGSLVPFGAATAEDVFGVEIDPSNLSGEAMNAAMELYSHGLEVVFSRDCALLGAAAGLVGRFGVSGVTLDATAMMERYAGSSDDALSEMARELPCSLYADPGTAGGVALAKAGVYPLVPAGNGGPTAVSETYGYQLDFALRTNAENARLLLQTGAVDRVYEDGAGATLGSGSYLQFTGVRQRDVNAEKLRQLMSAIRVVFAAPLETGCAVYGVGALDLNEAMVSTVAYTDDTVRAPLYLYDYPLRGSSLVLGEKKASGELTDLPVYAAKRLSVIVYLDGDCVDNSMVAHASTLSMEGTMNLQFSTDVRLSPADDPLLRFSTAGYSSGTASSSGGASGTFGEDLSWTLFGSGLLQISGSGSMGSGPVPWEEYRTGIRQVSVGAGVTDVMDDAFRGCDSLGSVSLPAGLERLGDRAFRGCRSLRSVTLPEGLERLGASAFARCTGLTAATLPASLTELPEGAFRSCHSLGDLRYTGTRAQWEALTVAPAGNYYLTAAPVRCSDGDRPAPTPAAAHSGACGAGLSWTLYDSGLLTVGGSGAMSDYTAGGAPWYPYREEVLAVELADGVTGIGTYAFTGLPGLERLLLPGSITDIGDHAYSPEASETFPGVVFFDGLRLQWSTIRVGADNNGLREENIVFLGDSSVVASGTCGEGLIWTFDLAGCLRISGSGAMGDYSDGSGTPWAAFRSSLREVIVAQGATSVGDCAFSQCEALESVALPEGIGSIGEAAFYRCTGLTALPIPESVEIIGERAFVGCTGLSAIRIPAGVTSVGDGAFASCLGFSEIGLAPGNDAYAVEDGVLFSSDRKTLAAWPAGKIESEYAIPAGVTAVSRYAFYTCAGLSAVALPEGLDSIGQSAFEGCTGLNEITLPESLRSIGEQAFYRCSSLSGIRIPAGVESIGQGAFARCTRLPEIGISSDNIHYRAVEGVLFTTDMKTLAAYPAGRTESGYSVPESVTELMASAFNGSGRLTLVELPEGLETIGNGAFRDCTALTGLTIPAGVTVMGANLFEGCRSLAGVTLPAGITDIGNSAFAGCTSLAEITVPEGVTAIGGSAFRGCAALTRIDLPASLRTVGDGAFDYAPASRAQVRFGGIRAQWREVSVGKENGGLTGAEIHCADDDISLGGGSCGEGLVWTLDVDGCLRVIGSGEMEDYSSVAETPWTGLRSSIREVVLSYGVRSVGAHAFQNCSGLTAVTIPGSVTAMGEAAFQNCTGLTQVVLPAGLERIEESVFRGCTGLTALTIPGSVTAIGENAFDYAPASRVQVSFGGKKAQWGAVTLGEGNTALEDALIRCQDGEVP